MYKLLPCLLTLCISLQLNAQIKTTCLNTAKLPAGIVCPGRLKEAVSFKDNTGDHIIVLTESAGDPSWSDQRERKKAWLEAYDYRLQDSMPVLQWKINDFITKCEVEITASFIKNTLQITDLNNDGIAEVWTMYKTACRGDVSPATMKIIMYQGKQKYAMRGENKVKVSVNEYYGGTYKFDAAFNAAPPAFRQFAEKLWNKNILETWQ